MVDPEGGGNGDAASMALEATGGLTGIHVDTETGPRYLSDGFQVGEGVAPVYCGYPATGCVLPQTERDGLRDLCRLLIDAGRSVVLAYEARSAPALRAAVAELSRVLEQPRREAGAKE